MAHSWKKERKGQERSTDKTHIFLPYHGKLPFLN